MDDARIRVAREALAEHDARDLSQDEVNGPRCVSCNVSLFLRDECEWPEDGALCDVCVDAERRMWLLHLRAVLLVHDALGATLADLDARMESWGHHGTPCADCGEPLNTLAGNPGQWPTLARPREPGVTRVVHQSCLWQEMKGFEARIAELEATLANECGAGPAPSGWRIDTQLSYLCWRKGDLRCFRVTPLTDPNTWEVRRATKKTIFGDTVVPSAPTARAAMIAADLADASAPDPTP